MRSLKDVEKDLEILHDFHDIMETYEEIAAIRMRKVKKAVLLEREFLKGLSDVFKFVEKAYDTYLIKLGNYRKGKTHFLKTNGKDVMVLLSANMGLYGEIVVSTINKFVEEAKANPNRDVVIIGKRAVRTFEILVPNRQYQYFDFSDSGIDEENMNRILDYILQYKNVYVYHGMFDTILNQEPTVTNLTGDISKFAKGDVNEQGEIEDPKFGLFEPTIEDVAAFFETQTLSVIFEQSMNESSLSKFASRMVTLDMAVSNVNEQIKKTHFNYKKLKHRKSNKQQITLISSIFALENTNAGK